MKFLISALLASAASAAFYRVSEPVADSYIVKFKDDAPEAVVSAHKKLAATNDATVEREWTIGNFRGYSVSIKDKALLSKIEQMPEVEWVEENGVVRISEEAPQDASCTSQQGSTWGITRTSVKKLDPTSEYSYVDTADGSGVTVYVIDTGIYIEHSEFAGRASWGTNTVGDGQDKDGNGHGTHCAGTIAGGTYGMAKKAKLVAVKVLSASGSGTMDGVIKGIEWAAKNRQGPAVGSMSLGGGKNTALNTAVASAVDSGLIMVVAAGNDNGQACTKSPASAPEAITVAASDNKDVKASFSNYGKCVDLYAPGVAVTSSWIGSPTAINTISGTSMACPHVAGQVAKYLETTPKAKGDDAKAWLVSQALQGVIDKNPIDTPNLLLFGDCNTFGKSSNATIPVYY